MFASNSDAVTFNDNGVNTLVTVTGAGVSPGSLTFSNKAKTYTFQGGPITGSVSPNINGGGTVIFSNSNTYSGATQIQNSSTLQVTNQAALPAAGSVNIAETIRPCS